MAHTVLYYHIIWRTKYSELTISEDHERSLYAYILGFCKNKRCTLIRIGGMPDHIHMFVSLRPDIALSSFVQVLKTETSKWMKENFTLFPRFNGWGVGYAAFTYSERDKEMIINYIINQKKHHSQKNLQEEYNKLLKEWHLDPSSDTLLKDSD